jgi:hypothetical protein
MSVVVISSGAVFSYQCWLGQVERAGWQPVVLYSWLLLLLLLPANMLFKVGPAADTGCPSVCPLVRQPARPPVCLSVRLSVRLSVHSSVRPSVRPSVRLSVCLSVWLSTTPVRWQS